MKYYIKAIAFVCFILSICFYGPINAFADQQIPEDKQISFGGSFITRDGEEIRVVEFGSTILDFFIEGTLRGSPVQVHPADLSEIWLLEEMNYGVAHNPGEMRLVTKDGDDYRLQDAYFYRSNTYYDFFNTETNELETAYVYFSDISLITIGHDVGEIKRCPHCGEIFPRDYLFCPFDATELEWFTPSWM